MAVKKYDLRWRYDFIDGRVKYGKWSSPGNCKESQAWSNNGEGLLYASVEGKHVGSGIISKLVTVDGSKFMNFQWIAACVSQSTSNSPPIHILIGMKLISSDWEYAVTADGKVKQTNISPSNSSINFATFGR